MKTERVTLLASPAFKTFLGTEARREGVSVAELVRSRCERRPSGDEAALAALTDELNRAVREARLALKSGLDEAQAVLAELRARQTSAAAANQAGTAAPARRGRKLVGARAA